MSSGAIIGALAFVTIGLVLIIAVVHFTAHLRDPKNREAAKRSMIDDGPSATTAVRGGSGAGNPEI